MTDKDLPGGRAGHAEDREPAVLKQRHQLFVALLVCIDACVVAVAAFGAWAMRRVLLEVSWPGTEWGAGLEKWIREPLFPFVIPISLLVMGAFGLYRPRRDGGVAGELWPVVRASVITTVILIVAIWVVGIREIGGWDDQSYLVIAGLEFDAARVQLAALLILMCVLLGAERVIFRLVLRFIRARGWNLRHVAVIGTGRLGRIVCRTLDRNSWTGIHVAYFISHNERATGSAECLGRPVLGGLGDLDEILEDNPPDAVYIALPTSRAVHRPQILRRLERYPMAVRIVPDIHPRYMLQNMAMSELDGMPVLSVRESPMHGVGGAAKRVIDLLGATFALAAFTPLMLLIALLVRWNSPGPAIFKQRRVSLGGESFDILKFRTMYHAEDEARPAKWTQRGDPRVTAVGRWLRRTSLDELPQLLNVIFGDMSLVGPRPERPELIARFREDWRGYMLRQHVKAGITGWAQVNGLRGDTSLRKRLQHDLFYIRHWSLGFDMKILWLTVLRGFIHRNAH